MSRQSVVMELDELLASTDGKFDTWPYKRVRDEEESEEEIKKNMALMNRRWVDPVQGLASVRHEFGEHGGVNMSIEASATFTVMEPETMSKLFKGELGADRDFYIYSRHFNPTVLNLGRQIAAMEGTEAAYCTASGMSAIASVLLQLCSSGDHIVASSCLYGGTHALLSHFFLRACSISTTFVDIDDLQSVQSAITGSTKIGHENGLTVVVDNTFSPLLLSPARMGADVVVHSVSKYISGQSDIIAGAVCAPARLVSEMMGLQQGSLMLLGPTMCPTVAFNISGRLPHLALRMREHCHRALIFATRMQRLGLKVIYPGLDDHPQHRLLKSMANEGYGFGGIVCVDLETTAKANKLMHRLQNLSRFGLMAVSLGYYETLMSCSGSSTSSEMTKEEQQSAGISPGLLRMSVGYTGSVEQRWRQLFDALVALNLVAEGSHWKDHE